MLSPKKTKYRKQHRGRMRGKAKGGVQVHFGDFGLQAMEPAWITNRQIEAARIAMTRHIKRGGKVWVNIFPDKPFTKKPAETRMGSGKGKPGVLGLRRQAGPRDVRDGGRRRRSGPRGVAPRGAQASDQDPVREPGRGRVMSKEADKLRELPRTSWKQSLPRRRRSCSTFASSSLPDSSTTRCRSKWCASRSRAS